MRTRGRSIGIATTLLVVLLGLNGIGYGLLARQVPPSESSPLDYVEWLRQLAERPAGPEIGPRGPDEVPATDAVTREFSVINADLGMLPATDAVSREFSIVNGDFGPPLVTDAISREFSIVNGDFGPATTTDAISREFSILNADLGPVAITDAVSREFSIVNAPEIPPLVTDAISREFSIYLPGPDLRVTALNADAVVDIGERVTIDWITTNIGAQPISGTWVDRVYLSSDEALGNDTLLAERALSRVLLVGESYVRGIEATMPATPGTYYILAVTDAAGQIAEAEAEGNNFTVRAIEVIDAPLPNLDVVTIAAPSVIEPGQPFTLTWATRNTGARPAVGNWTETVYYSADDQIGGDTVLQSFERFGDIAVGEVANRSEVVTLPSGVAIGLGRVVVCVDTAPATWPYRNVLESAETDNCGIEVVCIDCRQPDLHVTDVLTVSEATAGDTIAVQYTVTNVGIEPVVQNWADAIYVSSDTAIGSGDERLRLDPVNRAPLAPGQSYTISRSVALPVSFSASTVHAIVRADENRVLSELDRTNNTSASLPIVIAATPAADLSVLGLELVVDEAQFGDPIVLTWRGENIGTATADSAWSDSVFLSSDDTLDALDRPIGLPIAANATPLSTGSEYERTATLTLPLDLSTIPGDYYVLVKLDGNQAVQELSESNNVVASGLLRITLPELPNLLVSAINIPFNARVGDAVAVSFDVTNAGLLPVDTQFLLLVAASADAVVGDDVALLQIDSGLPFAPGEVRPYSVSVLVPELNTDAVHFMACADSGSDVLEAVEGDNCVIAAGATSYLRADLTPVSLTAPVSAFADGPLTVSFAVSNVGQAEARPFWIDAVYLSNDPVVGNDILVGSAARITGLQPGHTYPVGVDAVVPSHLAGVYYVIVETDRGNRVREVVSEQSNFRVSSTPTLITQPTRPDLIVDNVATPTPTLSGARLNAAWTLRNDGGSASGFWIDRLYASADGVLSADDLLLGGHAFTGTLAAGAVLPRSFTVDAPSLPGQWRLIVATDAASTINEGISGGEGNNERASDGQFEVRSFTATAETEITDAPAGTIVPISGSARIIGTNTPAVDVPVTVRVGTRGFERAMVVRTDVTGAFTTQFSPTSAEAGQYVLAAGPSHVSHPPQSDAFRLWGLRATPASLALRAIPGTATAARLNIANPGDLPLTGVQVSVTDVPPGVQIQTEQPDGASIPGLTTHELTISILATQPIATPVEMTIRVTTAQGAMSSTPLWLEVVAAQPRLQIVQGDLSDGVLRAAIRPGERTFAQFRVRNEGGVTSSAIDITLPLQPPFIGLLTPDPLPPLAPNAEATIALVIDTPVSEPVGGQYAGPITLNAIGNATSVQISLPVVSESRGDLRVSATDQFTYYAAGQPRVAGARVNVFDDLTGEIVASALTNSSGDVEFTGLPEAYYRIEASSQQRYTYRATQFVRGTQVTAVEAFMPYQAVTYTWTVVPEAFEDRYRIVINAEFQTQVPWPELELSPLTVDLTGLVTPTQVTYLITNRGFIAVDNVRFSVGASDKFRLTPLIESIGRIGAQQSVSVPVLVERISDTASDCSPIPVTACWDLPCGNRVYAFCASGVAYQGDCPPPPPFVPAPQPSGPPGSPPPPPGSQYTPPPNSAQPAPCRPGGACGPQCVQSLLALLPGRYCYLAFSFCLGGAAGTPTGKAQKAVSCISPVIDCSVSLIPGIGGVYTGLTGGCALMRDCIAGACDLYPCSIGDSLATLAAAAFEFDRGNLTPEQAFLREWVARTYAPQLLLTHVMGGPELLLGIDDSPEIESAWMAVAAAVIDDASADGAMISPAERDTLLAQPLPVGAAIGDAVRFVDRWNRSLAYWAQGIFNIADVPPGMDLDFIDIERLERFFELTVESQALAIDLGFEHPAAALQFAAEALRAQLTQSGEGVCATVQITVDQSAIVTRSAFRARLAVDNSGSDSLESLMVDLHITDEAGFDASDRFVIAPPELDSLSDVAGTGSIPGGAAGGASWLILPLDAAAPTTSTPYYVGGSFSYVLGGEFVTIQLAPVRIDVVPNPRLELAYFLERTVYSDDPFTPIVEPARPFSLGLLVRNVGAGVAANLRITSAQPEIVQNDRGLLADFQIIGTRVGTMQQSPSLTVALGDIAAGNVAVAQWLMTSSIQGEFISYQAQFEHITNFGDPRLTLIESVDVFALNHVVLASEPDDGQPDFLTDDLPDVLRLPDRLHLSDGTVATVTAVLDGDVTITEPNRTAAVQVPMSGAWTYARVPDPFGPAYRLERVTRANGTTLLTPYNAWQTDRINRFAPGSPRERFVHVFDSGGDGQYTLHYGLRCTGDVNQDNRVDLADLSVVLINFGLPVGQSLEGGDVTADGAVDLHDLAILLINFGLECGELN